MMVVSPAVGVETVCHRGANEKAPENTRAATQLCIDWGMDYVEIDVRTSKDDVLYILHDSTVNRTTDGEGKLRDLTSEQIDQLDAGSWFDAKFKGERVPRLEPYLKWVKGKIKVYFDVKDADLERVIKLVYDVGLEKDCFFWFGNRLQAGQFRKLDSNLTLKVNAKTVEEVAAAKRALNAQIIETSLSATTPEVKAAIHGAGMKLMVYHPEKDAAAFKRICEIGADMVNLNHGDLFREVETALAK
jgi:glycerophosphoryl diester phosphodiesterase